MICRIRGILETVSENRAELRCGDLVYEVLIPSYLENQLRPRRGETIDFFIKHYLEGGPAISALIPRLVGFQSEAEREFYNQLIKVPGLGAKSALRCLVAAPGEIARSIERGDKRALADLPGIGPRTADKVIASLKGKLAGFAALPAEERAPVTALDEMEEDAVKVLLKLSYRRNEAEELIRRARKRHPELDSAEAIVQTVLKELGRGVAR